MNSTMSEVEAKKPKPSSSEQVEDAAEQDKVESSKGKNLEEAL
jgi:hypothetical protein